MDTRGIDSPFLEYGGGGRWGGVLKDRFESLRACLYPKGTDRGEGQVHGEGKGVGESGGKKISKEGIWLRGYKGHLSENI